ncbi:putative baseplate assembly protein [Nocardioides albidus]|uniref:Putative baseplate assembly protein n=1 Tax=Nocardioides albidus TaxID=1517589 RepID=A0A5C4VV61_9ACTN|nr:putative baseplate assembly protein [Nocardioides albidus]TNM39707.1 putative baseplate assembly protein [Nocardioides albidus]
MSLPIPNLDDRRFQDLVDDAKRMVQQRCAEWTDHNVSDPGVTLIETFAFMTDELLYRLNRVPDRMYVTFLDLLGVTLHPPTPARVDVTAWLSAPPEETVALPAGAEVATLRTERDNAVVFGTTRDLAMPPRELRHVFVQAADGEPVSRDSELSLGTEFPCFAEQPAYDDALLLGLDDAAPSCAVAFRFSCQVQGVGVDPTAPPLAWEAWDGAAWIGCEVDRDDTGGLNREGDVIVHLPRTHTASLIANQRAGWVRCRAVPAIEGYPFYSSSPTISSAVAFTVGGTVEAVHAEVIEDEVLGMSEGVPGQVFRLAHGPVVSDGRELGLEVAAGGGWERWREVDSFAGCDADDSVFRVDRATGDVQFGPAVREPEGGLRMYGAVPAKGAPLRVRSYRVGGGPTGNVSAGLVRVLRTTVPGIDRVENRRAAIGGVAAETVEEAKLRGPLALRTRDRAVTAEDYDQLARSAAPQVARVRTVPASSAEEAGGVRVLLVPAAPADADGRLRFEDLVPTPETLQAVTDFIEERRTVGARVVVEPPFYQGVTVVATLVARLRAVPEELQREALLALNRYYSPLAGGPDGTGWPFGRPVQAGEVYAVLQRLAGTELVEDVALFGADPITGKRGQATQRIDLDRNALTFSFDHRIRVVSGG